VLRTSSRALALVVLLASAAVVATAKDDGRELSARVEGLMSVLRADDREAAEAAARDLGALGPDAVACIIKRLPKDNAWDAWDRLHEALDRMGAGVALAELMSLRDVWSAPRRTAIEGLEATLRERSLRGRAITVGLAPASIASPQQIPLSLRIPLLNAAALDEGLVPGGIPVFVKDGTLTVGEAIRLTTPPSVKRGKTAVLILGPRADPRRVAFFDVLGEWFAGPGSVLVGKFGGETLEVLDGDNDGRFDGAGDYVRLGGCFMRHPKDRLLQTRKGLMWYRFGGQPGAPVLELRPEIHPKWATSDQVRGIDWLNAWRGRSGIPPVHLSRGRSEACRLHSRYMTRHGLVHAEEKTAEGYTREGARAGKRSALVATGNSTTAFQRITATVLHRNECIGRTESGIGIGSGSGGCTLWGDGSAGEEMGQLLCVPAPGETDVPVLCRDEIPGPDSDPDFYRKARGYPISATFRDIYTSLREVRFQVLVARTGKPVEGVVFSPRSPYSKGRALNNSTAHFVADKPLRGGTTYAVVLTGEQDGKPVRHTWTFETR